MPDEPKKSQDEQAVDFPLLDLAEDVLTGAGYVTMRTELGGVASVVAENADNIVACTTALTVEDAVGLESLASAGLVRLLETSGYEKKRWDGYVAVLTGQEALPEANSRVFEANYNLRFVRRLLRTNVALEPLSVENALISILPLRGSAPSNILVPPMVRLAELLVEHGLEPDDVERATSRLLARSKSAGSDVSLPFEGEDDE